MKRKNVSLPLKVETDQFVICLVLPVKSVFLSKFVAFHPRTVNRIVTALMPSLLFRCFSLFLPHLRTLTEGERLENCLRFGTGGPSLCLYSLLSRNILFFPALTMAARAIKKNFWRSDMLTLSACTIGILSTLTYTEFDCAALLATLEFQLWRVQVFFFNKSRARNTPGLKIRRKIARTLE